MSDVAARKKVERLMCLALNAAASEAEARTAALLAIRLIDTYGLLTPARALGAKSGEPRKETVKTWSPKRGTVDEAPFRARVVNARFEGKCRRCHVRFAKGTPIIRRDEGWLHLGCGA